MGFRPGGVFTTSDGRHEWRTDAVRCNHCGMPCERKTSATVKGIIRRDRFDSVDDPNDIAGVCGGCGKPICVACARAAKQDGCMTISQRLDEYEVTQNVKLMQRGVLLHRD
jgi:hypothetical protein